MDDPSRRAIDRVVKLGLGDAVARNRRALDRFLDGGLTDALTRNQQALDRLLHQGLPDTMRTNQQALDRLVDGGFQDALQRNQQTIDRLISGGLADALTRNQEAIDRLVSGGAQDAMAKNREVLDRILQDGVPDALAQGQQLLESLMQSPAFASAIGVEQAPRAIWEKAIRDVDRAVGGDGSAEVRAELEAAADESDATSPAGAGLWWIARLPVAAQLTLATAIIEALVPLNDLLGDLGAYPAGPEYLHGAQLLLALATVLLVFVNARAQLAQDENNGD